MAESRPAFDRRQLRSPRAAGVAGVVFAVLFGASMVLIRSSVSGDPNTAMSQTQISSSSVTLALNLIPYAGIAFLWFIGVIRDRVGDMEDRLFATVLLGSGLLFLALTFVGAALAGGLLRSYASATDAMLESGVLLFGRQVMFDIVNIYAIRMAGVFMISLGTIWLRTGSMHRTWAYVTYALALTLLISIGYSLWMTLVFPTWVLAVSVYVLILSFRQESQVAPTVDA
jgi:hypothetical protein